MAFDYGAVLQHPQVGHIISNVFTWANCNDKKYSIMLIGSVRMYSKNCLQMMTFNLTGLYSVTSINKQKQNVKMYSIETNKGDHIQNHKKWLELHKVFCCTVQFSPFKLMPSIWHNMVNEDNKSSSCSFSHSGAALLVYELQRCFSSEPKLLCLRYETMPHKWINRQTDGWMYRYMDRFIYHLKGWLIAISLF